MGKRNSGRPLTDAELAEAKGLDHRFAEAMSRKDLEAAMACFWDDPDLIVVLDGTVYRGPEAVRAATREILDRNESLRVTVREVEVTQLPSGDGVIGVGTATIWKSASLRSLSSCVKTTCDRASSSAVTSPVRSRPARSSSMRSLLTSKPMSLSVRPKATARGRPT